jgi:hypothetical protein
MITSCANKNDTVMPSLQNNENLSLKYIFGEFLQT